MAEMQPKTKLAVRVRPGALRNQIAGFSGDVLEVRVAAPPVKGKANAELVAFLARVLGVDRRDVAIIRGVTSRNKLIAVSGLSRDEVLARLGKEGG